MAVVTTTVLSDSVQALYQAAYVMAARREYIYSQPPLSFTPAQGVIGMGNRGNAVNIPVYHKLLPSTTILSQTADVTPVTFGDNLITITPYLYGQVVQLSQQLSLTAFSDVERAAAENIGKDAADVRDRMARTAAVEGGVVVFGGDATSRATVSPASTSDELKYADFLNAVSFLGSNGGPRLPGPGGVAAIMSHQTYADQVEDGVIILVGEYGQKPEIILNGEIGTHIAGVRLIASDFAKVFQGAGATRAAASSAVLDTDVTAGMSTLTLKSTGPASAVGYWSIGTAEATGAGEQIATETILLTGSATTTAWSFVGAGPNGGLMYNHSSGVALHDNHQVHATVFMSAEALGMVYTNDDGLGPDGIIYPPEQTGLLKQFNSIGWKNFFGFGRIGENRLYRVEHAVTRYRLGD